MSERTIYKECGDEVDALAELISTRKQLAAVTAERDRLREGIKDLLESFEPLLIEIEPYRYAQMDEIERLVAEKKKWAERHNRTCGNSNEMWFYSTEFRRSLEGQLQPLLDAMRNANAAYDRRLRGQPATPDTGGEMSFASEIRRELGIASHSGNVCFPIHVVKQAAVQAEQLEKRLVEANRTIERLIERYPSCPEKDGWWIAKVSDPHGNIHEVAFATKAEAVLYETGLNKD